MTILATGSGRRGLARFNRIPHLRVVYLECLFAGRIGRRFGPAVGLLAITRMLLEEDPPPGFVHIHGLFSMITLHAARAARRAGIPYAIRPAGGLAPWCLAQGNAMAKRALLEWRVLEDLRNAAFVHATSDREAADIRRLVPDTRIVVIPPPVPVPTMLRRDVARSFNVDAWGIPAMDDYLLFLSRITAKKGARLLAEAFISVARSNPSLRLVYAGNDEGESAGVRRLLDGSGVADRVHFMGHVDGFAKQALLHGASMLVLPSRDENFAVVVAEAMAAGVPVLTCSGVDSHRFVDAANAGLTVPRNSRALERGIVELLAADRDALGARGRAFVREHLSPKSICARLDSAMARHGG